MTARRFGLVVGLIAALALGWSAFRYTRSPGGGAGARPGAKLTLQFFSHPTTLQPFSMRDLDGRTLASDSLRGKVTLVNFWATWCPPCRAEIPDLVALQEKYRDHLQVIGVSQDEAGPELVRQFAAEQRMNYPIVMSTPEIERVFTGIYALPTSFIIDRDLRIVQKHVGLLNAATTEAETRSLAGLKVNASIEHVEDSNRTLIQNAAQATRIPGLDLDQLSPAARATALKQLNADICTCGCGLTLAACRINDPTCSTSLPLARTIVDAAARQ